MITEQDKKIWLLFIIPFLLGHLVLYLWGYRISHMGDPAAIWLTFFAWCIFLLGYWKDKKELFKRCSVALPFVFFTVLVSNFTFLGITGSISAGVVMFMWLTGAKHKHFTFALSVGIFILVLLYLQLFLAKHLLAGSS